MNSGIINIYKEAGYTSFDVVARLRGILKIKKIGHTGTLDPDAEGVLPVCLNKATRVCELLSDHDKIYKCVLLLGVETDTYDLSGRVLKSSEVNCTVEEVTDAINCFVGDIMQVPPMYSALKVNGKKLYELAREGKEIERKSRPVTIYSIDIQDISLPEVTLEIHCSKGTYIRSLCHDIGEKLGCGGAMKSLLRTKVGQFDITDAKKIDEIEKIFKAGQLENVMIPLDQIFQSLNSFYVIPLEDAVKKAINGGSLLQSMIFSETISSFENGISYRGYLPDNRFLGIYTCENNELKLKKMFLE